MRSVQLYGDRRTTYTVYEDGRIIRNGRIGARGRVIKERELVARRNTSGYDRVGMVIDGKRREYFVHRVVAELFCEKPNGCNVVDHIDGNKQNNIAGNLEWVMSGENNKRAFAKGLKKPKALCGERHPMAKLSKEDVTYIKAHYVKGDSEFGQCGLARRFGVKQATIYEIVNNRSWIERPTNSFLNDNA